MRILSAALLERGFLIDPKPLSAIVAPKMSACASCNRSFILSYNCRGTQTQEGTTTDAYTRNHCPELCTRDMFSTAFAFPARANHCVGRISCRH